MWCDNWDGDLLKLLPHLPEFLGEEMCNIELWTHSSLTDGKINCPSSWNTDDGLAAFFSLNPEVPPVSQQMVTNHPLVRCTWLEVLRDEWAHHAIVMVHGYRVHSPNTRLFWQALKALRKPSEFTDRQHSEIRMLVENECHYSSMNLSKVVAQRKGL